jgi:hypothetical protein
MSEHKPERLIKDRHLPWPSSFPYERLNARLQAVGHFGVGPGSTSREIQDALFDLMGSGGSTQEDRQAWDELRLTARRLLVDFLLYRAHEPDDEFFGPSLWERPMPVQMPSLAALADVPIDLDQALETPGAMDPGRLPGPVPIDPDPISVPPLDIGPVPFDVISLYEEIDV